MSEGPVGQGPLQAGSPLRTPRAAAVAGIVFSVLLIAAFVLLRLSVPAGPSAAGAWLTDPGKRAAVAIALNLVPFAGIAFLWFIGVLRDRVGGREPLFRDGVPGQRPVVRGHALLGDAKVPLQLIMAKARHKNPRTAMRYIEPGGEAVAEITGLLGPSRRRH